MKQNTNSIKFLIPRLKKLNKMLTYPLFLFFNTWLRNSFAVLKSAVCLST